MLWCHLRPDLQNYFLPQGIPTKILRAFLPFAISGTVRAHLKLHLFIIRTFVNMLSSWSCFIFYVTRTYVRLSVFLSSPVLYTLCPFLIYDRQICVPVHNYLCDKWVPVTTAWRVLRLQMEERPPIWRVAANKLNKQSRTADKGWPSSLGVGPGANNGSSWEPMLRNTHTLTPLPHSDLRRGVFLEEVSRSR
jgi:hypothetical protein